MKGMRLLCLGSFAFAHGKLKRPCPSDQAAQTTLVQWPNNHRSLRARTRSPGAHSNDLRCIAQTTFCSRALGKTTLIADIARVAHRCVRRTRTRRSRGLLARPGREREKEAHLTRARSWGYLERSGTDEKARRRNGLVGLVQRINGSGFHLVLDFSYGVMVAHQILIYAITTPLVTLVR